MHCNSLFEVRSLLLLGKEVSELFLVLYVWERSLHLPAPMLQPLHPDNAAAILGPTAGSPHCQDDAQDLRQSCHVLSPHACFSLCI